MNSFQLELVDKLQKFKLFESWNIMLSFHLPKQALKGCKIFNLTTDLETLKMPLSSYSLLKSNIHWLIGKLTTRCTSIPNFKFFTLVKNEICHKTLQGCTMFFQN